MTKHDTPILGLDREPYRGQPRDLIGEVVRTSTGNVALRIGRMGGDEDGWQQIAYVVLSPREQKLLADALFETRAGV